MLLRSFVIAAWSMCVVADKKLVHCAEGRVRVITVKSVATCFLRQLGVRMSVGHSRRSGSACSERTGMPALLKMSATVSRRQLSPENHTV